MSSSDSAVSVRNVTKVYRIWQSPTSGLKALALATAARGCGSGLAERLRRRAVTYYRDFEALKAVSFEMRRGECLGIVGRNGSGKSTLLQIVAGTLAPTSGEVKANGRVTALLELGSGFNPDFTGRENVYVNGTILGLRKGELDAQFDAIAAFADIGDFIDQPVKTYSSGMVVRLAFAVQVLLDPDVLVVDEALAVGDIFFQHKCYAHMRRLRQRGTAILFVTHDMSAVMQFCDRAIVLERGACRFVGPSDQAAKVYQMDEAMGDLPARASPPVGLTDQEPSGTVAGASVQDWPEAGVFSNVAGRTQISNGWARCLRVALCDQQGMRCSVFEQGQRARFFYEIELLHDIEVGSGGVSIQDRTGQLVHVKHALQHPGIEPADFVRAGSLLRYRQDVEMNLAPGDYTFDVGFFQIPRDLFRKGRVSDEQFLKQHVRILETERFGPFQVVLRRHFEGFQLTHWGIADMPGESKCWIAAPPGSSGGNIEPK
jgi:lipopolysaccharide transport system ATP-binding protein